MSTGVYLLRFNGTDKVYIGQSINLETRYNSHVSKMKSGTSSKLLQEAFYTFGLPDMEVLIECSKNELDNVEAEAIEIYNAISNGFNRCATAGGKTFIQGEDHHNSIYSNEQLEKAFHLLVDSTELSFDSIGSLTGVSKNIIASISCLHSHTWLKDKYPDKYNELETNSKTKLRSRTIKRGVKVPIYELISPKGELHSISNTKQFAELNNLDAGHLSKLLKGTRKTHKGWKLHNSM